MQKGVNDRLEIEQRFEWERVRWLACVNLQPHTKKGQNLTPDKLMKFDWEKKKVKTDIDKQKKRAEYDRDWETSSAYQELDTVLF